MAVKTKDLSKDMLVELINLMIGQGIIKEGLITASYKHDLALQIRGIEQKLNVVEKGLKNKRLTRKMYRELVKKQNRLAILGNKKIEILKGFSDAS